MQVWPLVDVQSYMGHANINTTMIYAHHVPKRDAAEALTRMLAQEVEDDAPRVALLPPGTDWNPVKLVSTQVGR